MMGFGVKRSLKSGFISPDSLRECYFQYYRIHMLLLAPPTSQLPSSRSNLKIKLHINITRFHTTEMTLAKFDSAQFTTILIPLSGTELPQPLNT